jgi:nitroreductase
MRDLRRVPDVCDFARFVRSPGVLARCSAAVDLQPLCFPTVDKADRLAAERRDNAMITELLRSRFSVRKFQDKPIPDKLVQDILEAGRLSPSGGNEQPWFFGVVTETNLVAKIVEVTYQQEWIAKAPLLIVLCTVGVSDERGGRDIQKYRFPEYAEVIKKMDQDLYWALNQEEHQTKIAGTHMALAALEHGIGSCWVSRFDVKCLAKLLNLPTGCMPSEILVMGYPEQEQKLTKKKELDEVVFYNTFG